MARLRVLVGEAGILDCLAVGAVQLALQIAHFGDSACRDEDVADADVAVNGILRVKVDKAAGDLLPERRFLAVCQRWPLVLDHIPKAALLAVLEEQAVLVFALEDNQVFMGRRDRSERPRRTMFAWLLRRPHGVDTPARCAHHT